MTTAAPRAIYRHDYRPPAYWIDRVELEFELGENVTVVRARLQVRRNADVAGADTPLRLDGEKLTLRRVGLGGRDLDSGEFQASTDALEIPDVPHEFELFTEVEIDPANNRELSGLYRSSTTFCTQCEAEGFRRITYFADRPDVMATYTTTIIADAARFPVLLSNGNRIEERRLEDGRKLVRWHDPYPKPSYLFALVAADLRCQSETFVTRSGRTVRLELWVEPEHIDSCDHALRSLVKAMKWDEDVFGLEYDLDVYMVVAVNDFNMAAMENKGLNIFNAKYVLARPETATDDDYEAIEGVIGHEYFHNWTGNRVTCRDWFQLTLKEGLTVFRDEQFTADMTSAAVKRVHDVNILRTAQFAEDQSPSAHPIRPESYIEMNNFYTVTVYNKGAEVVRMIHTMVGQDGFARGLKLYLTRHDGQAATCEDFCRAMADATGFDLDQFFRWYSQVGTPVLEAEDSYDEAAGRLTLTLRQRPGVGATSRGGSAADSPQSDAPLHVPVAIGLLGADGQDLPVSLAQGEAAIDGTTAVLMLREREQTFVFGNLQERPLLSLLRGFSAPVQLSYPRPERDLAHIMGHDRDAVSRWDAGQTLAVSVIMAAVQQHGAGQPVTVSAAWQTAYGQILEDRRLDGSMLAAMISVPDERLLMQRCTVIDVEGIDYARRHVIAALVTQHRDRLLEVYRRHHVAGDAALDRAGVDRRRAKNAALALLCAAGDEQGVQLARAQFETAATMTDRYAALQCLVELGDQVCAVPLGEFYAQWRHDPLVVDKWLSVQATSRHPKTLERVLALRNHPEFSLEHPNRVRALLGAFSLRNPVRFHDASGAGYALLTDAMIALNGINPQTAARLITPMMQWRRFDPGRGQLMRQQLDRMAGVPELSKDLYEMVHRALAV